MAGLNLKPQRTVCGVLVLLTGEILEQSILKAMFCWYGKIQAMQVQLLGSVRACSTGLLSSLHLSLGSKLAN